MKKLLTLIFTVAVFNCFGQGSWTQKTQCPGSVRYRAIAFDVNGKCYMGMGASGNGITLNMKDLWEFDPIGNSWTQKADLTGPKRTNATACSMGNYGYVGLGSDNNTLLTDWWQYDAVNNVWMAMDDFPGIARFGAGAFSLMDRIFVGGGLDSANHAQNSFYAFDPVSNTWAAKANLPGGVSSMATFVSGQKGYFVGGALNGSVSATNQNAEYDPIANTWTQRAQFPAGNIYSAVGFALDGYGYVGTGFCGTLTDIWYRFSPYTNTWTQETNWPTGPRQWAVCCVAGTKAYVGTGNAFGGNIYNDWWEFSSAITGTTEINQANKNVAYHSETNQLVIKNIADGTTMKIYSVDGKLLFDNIVSENEIIPWSKMGLVIVVLNQSGKETTGKIICE